MAGRVESLAEKGMLYGQGWTTMRLMAEGIRRAAEAGEVTGDSIKAALEGLQGFDTGGVTAPVTFGPNDHWGVDGMRLYRVEGGQWRPLTGMRTEVGLLEGAGDWLRLLVIVVIASIGKVGGSAAAARLTGLSWRDATALGVLMNTRGLMQLIVLNVGLDLGVISPRLFAMLVLMAIVTTMATAPLMKALKVSHAG